MKTTIKLFTLLAAVLCLAACDKNREEMRHERTITYTVSDNGTQAASLRNPDRVTTTVHLNNDAEWQALLDKFCDYAKDGSSVTFRNAKSANKSATKEAVTYSTTDREAMKRWMAQMEDEGKTVTVTYDPATGTWNGRAYNAMPREHLLAGCPHGTYESVNDIVRNNVVIEKCRVIATFDSVSHTVYFTNTYHTYFNIPNGKWEFEMENDSVLYLYRSPNNYQRWIVYSMGDNSIVLGDIFCPSENYLIFSPVDNYETLYAQNYTDCWALMHIDREGAYGQSEYYVPESLIVELSMYGDMAFFPSCFSYSVVGDTTRLIYDLPNYDVNTVINVRNFFVVTGNSGDESWCWLDSLPYSETIDRWEGTDIPNPFRNFLFHHIIPEHK